jgi:hypothetical protein
MSVRLRRRGVYIATIVAMLAMTAGFALAAFPGTFTQFGGGTSNQNSGVFSGGPTIWAGGASVSLMQAAAPASSSCDSVTYATTAASVYLDGSALCSTATGTQWYEDFHFTATEASGDSDNFEWYVVGGANGAEQPFTVSESSTYTGSVTLDVYVEMGAANVNPLTLTSISATVSGS